MEALPEGSLDKSTVVACAECFENEGLRLAVATIGLACSSVCPGCGATGGSRLTKRALAGLDRSFFVHGPVHRTEFGGAPLISFNDRRPNDIEPGPGWPSRDATLFEEVLKIGFFWYGPPEWQVGIAENLDLLMHETGREKVIDRILQACMPARPPS